MNEMSLNTLCKAYGNPERVQLVACLSRKATVSELLAKCHLSQSALSQHLAILRDAQVVTAERIGKHVNYKASSQTHVQLAKTIIKLTS